MYIQRSHICHHTSNLIAVYEDYQNNDFTEITLIETVVSVKVRKISAKPKHIVQLKKER